MSDFKDRGPGCAGFRSFNWVKHLLAVLVVAGAMVGYYGSQLVLAVLPENEKASFAFTTKVGDTWNISLTHSVEKTLWEEFFRVEDLDRMTMTHTTFESLGWGFPYGEYEGNLTHRKDNRYELEMNRPFTSVPLRISEQAMQHLHHHNTDLDLIKLYGQGTKLDIKVMYRYQYWLRDF